MEKGVLKSGSKSGSGLYKVQQKFSYGQTLAGFALNIQNVTEINNTLLLSYFISFKQSAWNTNDHSESRSRVLAL